MLVQSTNKQENIYNRNQFMFASHSAHHVAKETFMTWLEVSSSGEKTEKVYCPNAHWLKNIFLLWIFQSGLKSGEIKNDLLPAKFLLQTRETHRCSRNWMKNNIGRKRTSSCSYCVVLWLMKRVEDWSIFAGVNELWQVFVNEMMPTFWAGTFFMRWRW